MGKSVSLVLGSGGARGYAHIGVIEALIDSGYKIEAISGSSMGALVGGLYASGKLSEYKEWILGLDIYEIIKLLDLSFSKDGLIKGDKVFNKLNEMIGDIKIEELPISFTAVATDLIEQKSIWFQKGSLIDAIRASIAIPTVFTPKKIDNKEYIDGGVLSPLPTLPLLSIKSDILIAVDAQSSKKGFKKAKVKKEQLDFQEKIIEYIRKYFLKDDMDLNLFKIVSKSLEMMQSKITRFELASHEPDIIINIPKQIADFYDFHRANELIEFGYNETKRVLS